MKRIKVALYEPEIPQNVGAIIRTCACFDVELYIIEPVGFLWQDANFRRAKLDYDIDVHRIESFGVFLDKFRNNRKILLTPHTDCYINDFQLQDNDILCFGRESNGIEVENMKYFDQLLAIKMLSNCRSLNLSVSVAITLTFFL